MRKATIAKTIALLLLCVFSYFITSSVMKKGRANAIVQTPEGAITRFNSNAVENGNRRTVIGKPEHSIHLEATKFSVDGHQLTVTAMVNIANDKQRDYIHIWSVRLYDSTLTTKLSEHQYLRQAFKTSLTQNTQPKFQDQFELEAGNYVAMIVLYTLRTGDDMAKLADDATANSLISASNFANVQIPSKSRVVFPTNKRF